MTSRLTAENPTTQLQAHFSQMSARCQPDVSQMSARCQPDVSQMSARCQPDASQMSASHQPANGQPSASHQPDFSRTSARFQPDFGPKCFCFLVISPGVPNGGEPCGSRQFTLFWSSCRLKRRRALWLSPFHIFFDDAPHQAPLFLGGGWLFLGCLFFFFRIWPIKRIEYKKSPKTLHEVRFPSKPKSWIFELLQRARKFLKQVLVSLSSRNLHQKCGLQHWYFDFWHALLVDTSNLAHCFSFNITSFFFKIWERQACDAATFSLIFQLRFFYRLGYISAIWHVFLLQNAESS